MKVQLPTYQLHGINWGMRDTVCVCAQVNGEPDNVMQQRTVCLLSRLFHISCIYAQVLMMKCNTALCAHHVAMYVLCTCVVSGNT